MKYREDLSPMVESCLEALADGVPLERVLQTYPLPSDDLRLMLQIAEDLRLAGLNIRVPGHAQAASKAQFLALAEQRRKQTGWPVIWRWLTRPRPHMGSLALGLGVFALLLVALSSTLALPGDGLYPVKLAAEQASITLADDPILRMKREESFDQNRASEVEALLDKNREDAVSFAGFLHKSKTGEWTAADISLIIDENLAAQAEDLTSVYVEIDGHTHANQQVHVNTLHPRLFKFTGTVKEVSNLGWQVGGLFVKNTPETTINGDVQVGSQVTIEIARIENQPDVMAFTVTVDTPAPTSTTTATRQPRQIQPPANTPVPEDDQNSSNPPEVENSPTPQPTAVGKDDDEDHSDDSESKDNHKEPTRAVTSTKKSDD